MSTTQHKAAVSSSSSMSQASTTASSNLSPPSNPPPPTSSGHSTKLPKFLHRQRDARDRSRSMTVGSSSSNSTSAAESEDARAVVPNTAAGPSSPASSSRMSPRPASRKGSKLFGGGNTQSKVNLAANATPEASPSPAPSSLTPTILEPTSSPSLTNSPRPTRSHLNSDRPNSLVTSFDSQMQNRMLLRVNNNLGSPARLADLSGKLTGWFQHAFSSTSDLSLPSSLSTPAAAATAAFARSLPASSSSSSAVVSSALAAASAVAGDSSSTKSRSKASSPGALMSHIPGKANFERAVRYVFPDSDVAQPDKSQDPIWLMGVQHPGYEPPPVPPFPSPASYANHHQLKGPLARPRSRDSIESRGSSPVPGALSPSPSATSSPTLSASPSRGKGILSSGSATADSPAWPPAFYEDYTSRIWLTYRSDFAPIRDGLLSDLEPPISLYDASALGTIQIQSVRHQHHQQYSTSETNDVRTGSPLPMDENPNPWWDRTSQMSVSTSPPKPRWGWGEKTWSKDTGWGCMLRTGQSLLAQALVHLHLSREWRKPQRSSPSMEYANYVKIISWFLDTPSPLAPFGVHRMALAGKELGTEIGCWFGPSTAAGAIRTLLRAFPDAGLAAAVAVDGTLSEADVYAASNSVPHHRQLLSEATSISSGISSKRSKATNKRRWGSQAVLVLVGIRLGLDNVNPIYYENVKKLFTFSQSVGIAGGRPSSSYYFIGYQADHLFYLDPHHTRPTIPLHPLRDISTTSSSPPSSAPPPSQTSASSSSLPVPSRSSPSTINENQNHTKSTPVSTTIATPPPTVHKSSKKTRLREPSKQFPEHSPIAINSPSSSSLSPSPSVILDPATQRYASAYTPMDLRTYHCSQVRKMPMSSLDPSMLLGFLCRDEADWHDLRTRISQLGTRSAVFTIQDEAPSWGDDSDSDVGMLSISEPGSDELSTEDEEDDLGDTSESPAGGDVFSLSDATLPEMEDDLNVQTPSTNSYRHVQTVTSANKQPAFYPFPEAGNESVGSGSRSLDTNSMSTDTGDDDDDWVVSSSGSKPSTPSASHQPLPRRTHLRSQSLGAAPTIRQHKLSSPSQ